VVTELTIIPDLWDSKRQGYKNTSLVPKEQREQFNRQLKALVTFVENDYQGEADAKWLKSAVKRFLHPETYPAVPEQRQGKRNSKQKVTVEELVKAYIRENNLSSKTISTLQTIANKVARFVHWVQVVEDRPEFHFYADDATIEVLGEFRSYIHNEYSFYKEHPDVFLPFEHQVKHLQGLSPNAFNSTMVRVNGVFNWAVRKGLMSCLDYKSFDMEGHDFHVPYFLTIEERDRLLELDLSLFPVRLAEHRDMFVFQCLVGCRYGDLCRLRKENVDGEFLQYIPSKTLNRGIGTAIRVPLVEKAKQILARVDATTDTLFPLHDKRSYNYDIQVLLALAGVDRKVTILNPKTRQEEQHPICKLASSHIARRTFIGNLYKRVQDPNLIGSMTGHCYNSKAFARYRVIDDEIKNNIIKTID
ncbi:MAG: site-specific integrase, partial [Bacteroidales bacterium]|nr:site-specific integrase [Bacteroidales bacterium]